MALDLTTAAAILKTRYEGFPEVKVLGFQDNPFFAMVPKDSGGAGDGEKVPMRYASVNARSATFSTAQSQSSSKSSKFAAWTITYQNNYSLAQITGKVLKAARTDVGAFIRAMNPEIESAFTSIYRDIERDLFRDASGFIGQGDSSTTVTATTFYLADAAQAHNFEVGMTVGAALNAASAIRSGSTVITGIDRDAGTLESATNWDTAITSLTNADYLFPVGDRLVANDTLKLYGLEAWAPTAAPTAGDSHFGVDRSVDVQRLAGIRYDASTGTPLDEALVNAQSIGAQNGAVPNMAFLNPIYMRQLLNSLGSKKEYNSMPAQGDKGEIADISFRTVVLHGDRGDINVMGHPLCQHNRAWMFDMRQLKLMSMGPFPAIINDDGAGEILRVYNADSVEARIGGYAQLVTQNAGCIINIKLA